MGGVTVASKSGRLFRSGDLELDVKKAGAPPFKTILVDVPWPTTKHKDNHSMGGVLAKHRYGTITNKTDLVNLGHSIKAIADTDCAIVMWVTWMHLALCFEMARVWGLRYRNGMPWIKKNAKTGKYQHNLGVWFLHCTELALVFSVGRPWGYKGNPRPARPGWIEAPRPVDANGKAIHSRKSCANGWTCSSLDLNWSCSRGKINRGGTRGGTSCP